ncbi:MAG TPA: Gfo/Idh/MocA family oxidoreductase, partial [Candidatus Latescibacteria bacterium]|nr:Gfo/Idh/MocA family oxidoreductase [Candidatus Latescibacterota bacterium]
LGMGRGHVEAYQAHPKAEVVAICDIDEGRLGQVGDRYGIARRYTDYWEMLEKEELDIVSVATPNSLHMPITVAALQAGCHVLCEKPLALNAQEAEKMVEKAEEVGRRLMVNFSYRFDPVSLALKDQVNNGVLGEPYFARTVWHRRRGIPGFGGWFGRREMAGGGPLIDLGVHRVDLALWLMGFPQPEVALGGTYDFLGRELARREGKVFDVEDLAVGLVRFTNRAMLEVEASWTIHRHEREFMETWVYGTKGGVVHRNVRETYEFEGWVFIEEGGYLVDKQLLPLRKESPNAMWALVDAILNDRPHPATGEEGLYVMRILDAIYESARKGEPVWFE